MLRPQGAAAMDDENEPQSGRPQRPPTRTEQLRIVGAEEAGALMGQANRGGPEGGGAPGPGNEGVDNGRRPGPDEVLADDRDDNLHNSIDNGIDNGIDDDVADDLDDDFDDDFEEAVPGGRRPRSVFESIPDAPSSFLDEM